MTAASPFVSVPSMQEVLAFLIKHGHTVVFVWVLAAQANVPVPVVPTLLAAGALAGAGALDLRLLLLLSVVASLLGDGLWYALGRRHGHGVLAFLCRISLEPDSCVRRTQDVFARRGGATLVFGKFVPGLSSVAPPLAGLVRMPVWSFVALSIVSALLWSSVWLLLGYAFHDGLERLVDNAAVTGTWLLLSFVLVVVGWIGVRLLRRRRFLRDLRIARIGPQEVHRLQTEGVNIMVVDLRHAADFAVDPHVIPGALRIDAELLDARHAEIPRDRDVVLYCT